MAVFRHRGSLRSSLTSSFTPSPSTGMQHIPTRVFSLAGTREMLCKLSDIFCKTRAGEGCAIYSDTVQRAVRYTVTLCRGLCDIQ